MWLSFLFKELFKEGSPLKLGRRGFFRNLARVPSILHFWERVLLVRNSTNNKYFGDITWIIHFIVHIEQLLFDDEGNLYCNEK